MATRIKPLRVTLSLTATDGEFGPGLFSVYAHHMLTVPPGPELLDALQSDLSTAINAAIQTRAVVDHIRALAEQDAVDRLNAEEEATPIT